MAVSDQEVSAWLAANPFATDAQIAAAMDQYGVSSAQLARVTGLSVPMVEQRKAAAQRQELQSTFDPRVAESQYTLPSQRTGTMAERGDDYQVYEEVAKQGPLTYYQTYDAYGNATGTPFAINTGDTVKDFLTAATMFGSVVGAPWLSSVIGAAAPTLSNAAVQGLTGAAIGGGGTLLTGGSLEDALKNALLAGGAAYGASSLFGPTETATIADRADVLADVSNLQQQGLSTSQIADVLELSGYSSELIDKGLAAVTAPTTRTSVPSIVETPTNMVITDTAAVNIPAIVGGATAGLLSGAATTQTQQSTTADQKIEIVSDRPTDTSVVSGGIGGLLGDEIVQSSVTSSIEDLPGAGENIEVVDDRIDDKKDVIVKDIIDTIEVVDDRIDDKKDVTVDDRIDDKKDVTVKDIIDTIGTVGGVVGLIDSATSGDNGFDIVDIPSDWRTPTVPSGSAWPRLTPIDFGTRKLLRGTQWERFINQPVPQVPVVQPQQMRMSYADLVSALQGKQGPRLTINDVISGIQGQYGQVNPSAMG